METDDIFKYVKANQFVPEFTDLKYDSMFKHKKRKINGNGKPIDFSKEEKRAIKEGLKVFLKKAIK